MKIVIVRITVYDEETGEIEKEFIQNYECRYRYSHQTAFRKLMDRLEEFVFGKEDD